MEIACMSNQFYVAPVPPQCIGARPHSITVKAQKRHFSLDILDSTTDHISNMLILMNSVCTEDVQLQRQTPASESAWKMRMEGF